jgi:tetratricopeptide (TPR) repeat protein
MLELGRAFAGRQDYSRSVYVLAQARERAPKNAEILFALAHAAEDAGFLGDSALAYDEYLALRPEDDRARLDRARVSCLTGTRREEGLKETEWYIRKHPADPMGFFILAQFTWETKPEAALGQLSQALRVDPVFTPALYARAWLLQRLGRIQESLPDLEATVRLAPGNVRALDQLGLAYLSLDRPAEAENPNDVRDRVVLENLPLVKAIAIRVHESLPVHVELDDLIHAGILGLFDAATKFNRVTVYSRFCAYQSSRLRGSLVWLKKRRSLRRSSASQLGEC